MSAMELVHSIDAHHKKCWSVSAHPTLPLVASASSDKSAKVFKIGGKYPELGHLEETHKRSVRAVAFKPPVGGAEHPTPDFFDLPAVAVGSFDSTISVWGVDEPDTEYDESEMMAHQREILSSTNNQWSLMAIIEGHENEVKCVAWNWQGTLLASCSRDKTVWIWETDPETLEEFECVSVLNDHSGDVKHVAWHPSQDLLASSSYDDTIRIYREDDDDWECVGVLNGHEGTVWCSQFDPRSAGIRLVSVSDDMTARVWRTNDSLPDKSDELPSSIRHSSEMEWVEECTLPAAHKYPIYSVAWSKASGRIVTAGADGMLVVYEESDGKWSIVATKEYAHGVYEVNSVTFAEADDGAEVIISGGDDGKVNVWKLSK